MARGTRTNLADLAAVVGDKSPVEHATTRTEAGPSRSAALSDLTPNPRNPRDDVGNLEDLASIADMQLQPAVVVTAKAYQLLYPEDAIATRYVVINGCRRLAAAHKYGRRDLDIVVNDEIARDRVTLISASIAENVDRQDFDVIEEARAVEALVQECGQGIDAAARLRKTPAWVSQRRALLQLAPELQTALRRGELAIREARNLARVPHAEQVAKWQAALDRQREPGAGSGSGERPVAPSRIVAKALREFDHNPEGLADALHGYLGTGGVHRLLALLAERTDATAAS
ncbi:MAG: ParB family transcriptional regulator, chromosome partitioning protein [Mycobacterium sp.]|nr:ParB family transcriptional regulator, chromosome partitioning protein [Mycobacterium sp.]